MVGEDTVEDTEDTEDMEAGEDTAGADPGLEEAGEAIGVDAFSAVMPRRRQCALGTSY